MFDYHHMVLGELSNITPKHDKYDYTHDWVCTLEEKHVFLTNLCN